MNIYMPNTSSQNVQISIHDMTGKVMSNSNSFGETIRFNTSDLPRGSYLIRVQDGEYAFTRRFVKI